MFVKHKKKSFLVIGLGRFGSNFARYAHQLGCEVVAVDEDSEKSSALVEDVTEAISGNIHDENFLKSLGISHFDAVVVAIGQDVESSILITALARDLGAKYVVARASHDLHAKILEKIGSDWVVTAEKEMGKKLALSLSSNIIESFDLSADFKFVEIKVLDNWVGKKVSDIHLFMKKNLMLVAIKREEIIILNKDDDFIFEQGDIVVICGNSKVLMTLND